MTRSIFVVCAALLLAACATEKKEEKVMEGMKNPINCATAQGDLRVLKSEKTHTDSQIAQGITSIVPTSALIGLVSGTEKTKLEVASGDYNKAIDKRIAEIKSKCGV